MRGCMLLGASIVKVLFGLHLRGSNGFTYELGDAANGRRNQRITARLTGIQAMPWAPKKSLPKVECMPATMEHEHSINEWDIGRNGPEFSPCFRAANDGSGTGIPRHEDPPEYGWPWSRLANLSWDSLPVGIKTPAITLRYKLQHHESGGAYTEKLAAQHEER